jgi:hypothetical protein
VILLIAEDVLRAMAGVEDGTVERVKAAAMDSISRRMKANAAV